MFEKDRLDSPQDTCGAAPEVFTLFSRTLPLIHREYIFQPDAQRDAEQIARSNRGHQISILKFVASVCEPLPDLEWTDGRPAGDGRDHMQPMGLVSNQAYETAKQMQQRADRVGCVERNTR